MAARRILAKEPAARILVLSAHEDAMHIFRPFRAQFLSGRSAELAAGAH
jgi:hypothetical protein